jgi:hypothetical protein
MAKWRDGQAEHTICGQQELTIELPTEPCQPRVIGLYPTTDIAILRLKDPSSPMPRSFGLGTSYWR